MPIPYRTYRCGDMTCGAPDCTTCNPHAEEYVAEQQREAETEQRQAERQANLRDIQSEALDASIGHWKRLATNAARPDEAIGMSHCALCKEFFDEGCKDCPVFLHTGKPSCRVTPYSAAEDEYLAGCYFEPSRLAYPPFLAAAQRELDFLLKVKASLSL